MSVEQSPEKREVMLQKLRYDKCVGAVGRLIEYYDGENGAFTGKDKKRTYTKSAVIDLRKDDGLVAVRSALTDHMRYVVTTLFNNARLGDDIIDAVVTYIPKEFEIAPAEGSPSINIGFVRRGGKDPWIVTGTRYRPEKLKFKPNPKTLISKLQIASFDEMTAVVNGKNSKYNEVLPENIMEVLQMTAARTVGQPDLLV